MQTRTVTSEDDLILEADEKGVGQPGELIFKTGGVERARITQGGNFVSTIATPTYSASISPNAGAGQWQTITVTNNSIFTINAPTNPPDATHTQELTIEISNTSGGAMGVITWNAAFVFAGVTWANPGSAKKRFARFEWNGLVWACTGFSTADY